MSEAIAVERGGNILRIALLEDGRLAELFTEDPEQAGLTGNIYLGRAENVLPSRFAFVDIGERENAFMFLNDPKNSPVRKGQELLVQAVREPDGQKGACVVTQINYTGRYCVLCAGAGAFASVSKKICAPEEILRLKALAPAKSGVIFRTNCEGAADDVIQAELAQLEAARWEDENRARYAKAPLLVRGREEPLRRHLNDLLNPRTAYVAVNDPADAERLRLAFPDAAAKIKLYDGEPPLFRRLNIESQIQKALVKKAALPCGGFLIIERTEALNVIDVNSGKFQGRRDHEASVLAVNLEAAREIARQIRLRNLSGIIIIDFIDMKTEAARQELLALLAAETAKDRIGVTLAGMTALGLVELTRKRVGQPLEDTLITVNL